MTLAMTVDGQTWPLGGPDALHAFFSTVCVRLENGEWGSRYPVLNGPLYEGLLTAADAEAALVELRVVRQALALRPASELVWDADDPAARPPWGERLDAPDLLHCFFTPEGRPLADVLVAALTRLRVSGAGEVRIVEAAGVPA